ncbi:acylphosphatase [Ereboglobus luteus]|uniref:acylphosphatase n=1 Tax=Ereboglobus luteus TaxID=1796921 RepID=A0A2U8E089_9BACT|nr:acylphosphatase [Ereboglobus luteus]AWI08250.1 acylphosphatase [Ereboglobus luteus]
MTEPANTTYHETVYFAGHVQGVGFRYTTMQVAREYEVAGYVTNILDGRVHIEAEGRESEVKGFITALEDRMHGYIRKTERIPSRRPPEFSGFAIR